MNKELLTKQYGFTVIEILIALAILTLTLPALLTIIWADQTAAFTLQRRSEALDLAQASLDAARISSINNLQNSTNNEPPYQTTLTVQSLNLYTKEVTATVSWPADYAPAGSVSLRTLVIDAAAALSGNTCLISPELSQFGQILGTISFGIGNTPTAVAARNHLAYVTTDSATASVEDFFVVDVNDPTHLIIVVKLNTGPGLSSLAVAGNLVYAGNTSINGQLQIIDVSNPQAPVLVKTYKLPGTYTDNTTITNALAYNAHKIFLGTQKSQIAEFHVIDVSNSNAPQELGSYEVNAGINALAVAGSRVYIASPAAEEVKVLDISNPSNPNYVGGFNAPGGSGNGKSLALLDSSLFLGRTIGGKELYALDAAQPSLTALISTDLNTSIINLIAVPGWLYLAATDPIKTVQLWNVSNPTNPLFSKSLTASGTPSGLACGLGYLYLTTTNGLFIISP